MARGPSVDALLLAGGRSSRFGSDKAFLDWRGRPLFERQLAILAKLRPDRTWLSARAGQPFPEGDEAFLRIDDEREDLGPVGGLLHAFRGSRADLVVVLGVDLPLMESDFLAGLVAASTSTSGAVPRSEPSWEPLAAVYPRAPMLRLLEEAVSSGDLKMQNLLDQAAESGWISAHPIEAGEEILFTNLNSTRDLERIGGADRDQKIELERYRRSEGTRRDDDYVAAEEPLEVRVNGTSVAVMMRTPGHDEELATGFLCTESVIRAASEIEEIAHCPDLDRESAGNTLDVRLHREPDLGELTRHVFTSSSCGVCGKATIDSVFRQFPPIRAGKPFPGDVFLELPDRIRAAQKTFERTGGLHASAVFSREGELLLVREDVGRHNALDKVIGSGLRDRIDFCDKILLVSGRISFELMQKSLAVGIPAVAGISAPSSLAVHLARESGQTLVGFLRGRGFNLYAGKLAS